MAAETQTDCSRCHSAFISDAIRSDYLPSGGWGPRPESGMCVYICGLGRGPANVQALVQLEAKGVVLITGCMHLVKCCAVNLTLPCP